MKPTAFKIPERKKQPAKVPVGDGLQYGADGVPRLHLATGSPFSFVKQGLNLQFGFGLQVEDGVLSLSGEHKYHPGDGLSLRANSFELKLPENSGLEASSLGLKISTDKTLKLENGNLKLNGEHVAGSSLKFMNGKLEVRVAKGLTITKDGVSVLLGEGLSWVVDEGGVRIALAKPKLGTWQNIEGDIKQQEDLMSLLKGKAAVEHVHSAEEIVTGILRPGVIPKISAEKIKGGTLDPEVLGVIPAEKIAGKISRERLQDIEDAEILDKHIDSVSAEKIIGKIDVEKLGENFAKGKVLTAKGWEFPFAKRVCLRPTNMSNPSYAVGLEAGGINGAGFQFSVPYGVGSIQKITAVFATETDETVCIKLKTHIDFQDLNNDNYSDMSHPVTITKNKNVEVMKDSLLVSPGDLVFIRVEREAVHPDDKFIDTIYLKYVIVELDEKNSF